MALKYVEVPPKNQKQVDESRGVIRDRLQEFKERLPQSLRERVESYLDDTQLDAVVELYVDPGTEAHWGSANGFCVHLHPRTFDPWSVTGTPRLTAVLFHEMVHIAGGSELDAEVFENLLFTKDEGACPPTVADWQEFETNQGKGLWVSVNLNSGWVTDKLGKGLCSIEQGRTDEDSRLIPLGWPVPTRREVVMTTADPTHAKATGKPNLGVRIMIEFTGHIDKEKIETLINGFRTTIYANVENSGG